ncbi:MAG: hypothetical protein G8D61_09605 [gamma proteobacterium symbiont of Ctena orbiculata]|nr:hypothetical protein [Candidatus Thiodiazotropha sp. (ex Lucina pensylvanica)]MBT3064785.1 hypothetical protein [Candidatus Thiodiazotropha sp. (ex Lucina pensylvanica)]MBV2095594.1 hypothetical protein [Candidatus Thiodiazotropha sp. (ex Codakia orbicularis)]PUB73201.1 MAG: hypothetical protein DBP03_13485 [gamma proteobacterium symbiont of Ctena orbiculata]
MDWTKIIWALLLGAMILFLWPRAKQMLKHSPKAEKGDWQAVLLPLAFVVGFVVLLIMMV